MGQYYMAILGKVYGLNCKVSDRSVNHEYTLASYDIEQLATVEVSVTLIDAESGEAITLKELGSGQDSFDKSVAKAQTIAIKYCSLNSLAIATYDNPEADRHTDEVMQPKPAPQKNNSSNNLICHDCGSAISQKVADYSKSK